MFAVFDAINEFVLSTLLCYVECCNRNVCAMNLTYSLSNFVTFYLFIYLLHMCLWCGCVKNVINLFKKKKKINNLS